MKKALIFEGDFIQVEDEEFPVAEPLYWVDAPDDATPTTHIFDGENFILKPPPVPVVPKQVTIRQARLALLNAGLLQTVNNTIASLPGDEGEAARIAWEYSTIIERDSPLVASLGAIVGLTPTHLDELFLAASTL